MKILKVIGIVLFIIIAIPLIVALFVPKSYIVSVSETINQPQQVVYDYVRVLDNQKDYSVWVMADPELNPEIIGVDGTVGAIQRWNSKMKNVGQGEQEIAALTPDRMEVELRFIEPFEGTAKAANIFTALSDNETRLTSEFYSKDSYPMNLMSYFVGRKMIREAQTQNLKNIKKILEESYSNKEM
ncbi:MAG: SRPBCC family protein [Bacteroidales bacterium]|nr:SRPBCC family protein [Bacteroidales bacterium]